MLVLEPDDWVGVEVAAIDVLHPRISWLAEDPAHVGVEQAAGCVVGIAVGVGEAVVEPVAEDPPSAGGRVQVSLEVRSG